VAPRPTREVEPEEDFFQAAQRQAEEAVAAAATAESGPVVAGGETEPETAEAAESAEEGEAVVHTAVDYATRMRLKQWYPMIVTVDGKAAESSTSPKAQLTVRPVFPGCTVNPPSKLVPLAGRKTEVRFSVRPGLSGDLSDSRVTLHLPGRHVGHVRTPSKAVGGLMPKLVGLLALVAFGGLYAWMALTQVNWVEWKGGKGDLLANLWDGVVYAFLGVGWIPWAALIGLMALAVVLNRVAYRPQRGKTDVQPVRLGPAE